jgi:glycerol-1-phosphate dehydrogenase [NAD(P)+]
MSNTLQPLLDGRLADIDGGAALSVPTKAVVIEPSLAGMEAELIRRLELGTRLAVVSDPTTRRVLGERVERAVESIATLETVVLPDHPHADSDVAAGIAKATQSADALIAVGSGTINDLCKFASARAGKPYAVFATAPSMNGYTSVNAAITEHGHKKSLQAQGAAGVFIDLDIFAKAPPRMIRSGLGDSLCRPTAQADWLLAHRLLDRPYRRAPFALLADDEAPLFAEPHGLLRGDLEAMARLARTLALSGFGMTVCGGSDPASQGEHLIAHYIEMLADPAWPQSFHGEQVAVATLTMARLQEDMLAGPAPVLRAPSPGASDFDRRFGPEIGRSCWREFAKKCFDDETVDALNERLAAEWPEITEEISEIAVPAGHLRETLRKIDAPLGPEDLGLPAGFYRDAVVHAREIRDRYTFLDLAADSGRFEGGFEP